MPKFKTILYASFLFAFLSANAQNTYNIEWLSKPIKENNGENNFESIWFKNAILPFQNSNTPYFYKVFKGQLEFSVKKTKVEIAKTEEFKFINQSDLSNDFEIQQGLINPQYDPYSYILIKPLRKNNKGEIEKLISFELSSNSNQKKKAANKFKFKSTQTSELASGEIYKIGITKTGVYKIDQSTLSSLGIDVGSFNPKNIQILGNGTGVLPESIQDYTPITLQETPCYVKGEEDNQFNSSDYILFYGVGPHTWKYNSSSKQFNHVQNIYSDTAYYFIKIGSSPGKRISTIDNSGLLENKTIDKFYHFDFHELDKVNLVKSGKMWFGESFKDQVQQTFTFATPDVANGEKVYFRSNFAFKSLVSSNNKMNIYVNNTFHNQTPNVNNVSGDYNSTQAILYNHFDSISSPSTSNALKFYYLKPQVSSEAWLDYIEIWYQKKLIYNDQQLNFRSHENLGLGSINKYQISNASNIEFLWKVTNPLQTTNIKTSLSGSNILFKNQSDSIESFIAFKNTDAFSPIPISKIKNQNLLSLVDIDYILISHPNFTSETERLAEFHKTNSGLSTAIVSPQEIYNEFSSGSQDVTAIRNFLKFLYDNASSASTRVKYVFLMGDGSYDPKYRLKIGDKSINTNYIPAYQSLESLSPTVTFTSDDYYAMLDDVNGITSFLSGNDIAIGRFPAHSTSQAKGFVDKVIKYSQSSTMSDITGSSIKWKDTYGDWKNKVCFVADDGNLSDGFTSLHMEEADETNDTIQGVDSTYNVQKIYFDTYLKNTSAASSSYPDVEREINENINSGVFLVSYHGHGGEVGWADEKVLEIQDILNWKNETRLPIFLTATCEFSRYDDPERTAAGEHVILRDNGGAIAMFTTLRVVYGGSSNNVYMAKKFARNLYQNSTKSLPLGEIIRLTKIQSPLGTNNNNRKFGLLGDPAMKAAIPTYKVQTTKINNINTSSFTDTLKALTKVKVEGEVLNPDNTPASNYNGVVICTVFDKTSKVLTLNNNNKPKIDTIIVRNSIVYKGKSLVTNGKFSYEFIVPKDINYSIGKGKMSYYLANENTEGNGYYQNFRIGGSSPIAFADNKGPEIELYLYYTNFVNGGLTNQSPLLLAFLNDESGINTSGNGIGHDITLTLDNETSNKIILNDFYEADLNSYQSGSLKYQLENLSDGEHNIKLKAWDVNNNSGEASIDFIVASSSSIALDHVLNYPNPFTTNTKFYFEHNSSNSDLTVRIKIYTITGKIIKTIETFVNNNGSLRSNGIDWDGLDDYGDRIGKGVYLYQLEVETSDGQTDSKVEKLVILR